MQCYLINIHQHNMRYHQPSIHSEPQRYLIHHWSTLRIRRLTPVTRAHRIGWETINKQKEKCNLATKQKSCHVGFQE